MSPPELSIRQAGIHDVELLASWAQTMAMETEQKQLDADTVLKGVQAGIADPKRARYFIAMSGDQPAGTLMLTTEWSDWRNGDWWWIQSVYVHPDFRRQGVFQSLYHYVKEMAGQTPGVCGLRLYVEHENVNAQKTYEKLGMQDAGYRMMEVLL
ncbi:MAG TPA: GNAT family N-acetyltransferase [Arenimonas sp.]|jgi:ribosomal protein S18 acetylase RimI-like enzyme|nr:GNAT family N-acetyltransferase [Arenimonas sp.]